MKETQKHTPGPWKIRTAGTMTGRGPEVYMEGPHYDDGSQFVIAECGCSEATNGGKRWKKTFDAAAIEANARLIAAAPDLLEALKDSSQYLETIFPRENSNGPIRDAIRRYRELIAKAEGRS